MGGAGSSRQGVSVCAVILGITAAGKVYALIGGSGLLDLPHPFLPGVYLHHVWLGLVLEVAALGALCVVGQRAFLAACLGLSAIFVTYHALEVGLHVTSPCPCLGGLLGRWKLLADLESTISFMMAAGLGVASFVALFPRRASIALPERGPVKATSLVMAGAIWVVCGGTVLALWHGRVLGGDEGMEAAKALQFARAPGEWAKVWNDQPPLLSYVGALAFDTVGPSMSVARLAALALGLGLSITLAVFCSQLRAPWAAPVFVGFCWLLLPESWGAFMQEAPAYALGVTALLPLLRGGSGKREFGLSVAIAAVALAVKLTAAFALVVPFTWLWQRSLRRALVWGFSVVGLTAFGSWFLPGWSWATMWAAHVESTGSQVGLYRFQPEIYAQGWLVCALALAAVGKRYVGMSLAPLVPWVAAEVVALAIHLVHRPFFSYYSLHLITPMAVLGAIGLVDVWTWIRDRGLPALERWALVCSVAIACSVWGWQRVDAIDVQWRGSLAIADSPIVQRLASLPESDRKAFAQNPTWTFTAGLVQTPPEFTIVSMKRAWSGQIDDETLVDKLATNNLAAVVVRRDYLNKGSWSNLLTGFTATARSGDEVLFVANRLKPQPLDLSDRREWWSLLGIQP